MKNLLNSELSFSDITKKNRPSLFALNLASVLADHSFSRTQFDPISFIPQIDLASLQDREVVCGRNLDGHKTLSIENAFSISDRGEYLLLSSSVPDVPLYILKDSPLMSMYRQIGDSVRLMNILPAISALPLELIYNRGNLYPGHRSPAITIDIKIDKTTQVIQFERVRRTLLNNLKNFSEDSFLQVLSDNQDSNYEQAKLFFELGTNWTKTWYPREITDDDKIQRIKVIRDSLSRITNFAVASLFKEHNLPAVFINLPKNTPQRENSSFVEVMELKGKSINYSRISEPAFKISTKGSAHSIAPITAPYRRLADLVNQQILINFLTVGEQLYSLEELRSIIKTCADSLSTKHSAIRDSSRSNKTTNRPSRALGQIEKLLKSEYSVESENHIINLIAKIENQKKFEKQATLVLAAPTEWQQAKTFAVIKLISQIRKDYNCAHRVGEQLIRILGSFSIKEKLSEHGFFIVNFKFYNNEIQQKIRLPAKLPTMIELALALKASGFINEADEIFCIREKLLPKLKINTVKTIKSPEDGPKNNSFNFQSRAPSLLDCFQHVHGWNRVIYASKSDNNDSHTISTATLITREESISVEEVGKLDQPSTQFELAKKMLIRLEDKGLITEMLWPKMSKEIIGDLATCLNTDERLSVLYSALPLLKLNAARDSWKFSEFEYSPKKIGDLVFYCCEGSLEKGSAQVIEKAYGWTKSEARYRVAIRHLRNQFNIEPQPLINVLKKICQEYGINEPTIMTYRQDFNGFATTIEISLASRNLDFHARGFTPQSSHNEAILLALHRLVNIFTREQTSNE